MQNLYDTAEDVRQSLAQHGYLADRAVSMAVFLALKLETPLFLEGAPGVGKTFLAQAMANALGRPLVRLQCYEGIDRESALYDWNFARQMLHIRVVQTIADADRNQLEQELFSRPFLLRRPLLAAIEPEGPAPVLLIDEIDRSDEEFEAFLLELLSEFQVTIPEIGTFRAHEKPLVFLTSNRTREVNDALKRRCLYQWIDYPDFAREYQILQAAVPGLPEQLGQKAVAFAQQLRQEPLAKLPGLAETVTWARALLVLGTQALDAQQIEDTLGCLLKFRDDIEALTRPDAQGQRALARVMALAGVS